jgi:quinol---cytochrome c reductase iron-sulfur subunit
MSDPSGNASKRGIRLIAASFSLSALASIALTIVYGLGGHPQAEGTLLGVALGGLAVGLVAWAKHLMPQGPYVQERALTPGSVETGAEPDLERDFEAGAARIERRSFLGKLLAAAATALGAAALFPIRSLGTGPGSALRHTHWATGTRAVTHDGALVRPQQVVVDGVLTVFPEGHTDAADSQTLLIRLATGEYRPLPGREDWAPDDLVAFSKVCTHAGCPVGLYQADSKELFCPCHQSVFDVLAAAEPTDGPATRRLPQLPLAVDDEGYLVAQSDFTEPIGPGFWSRERD